MNWIQIIFKVICDGNHKLAHLRCIAESNLNSEGQCSEFPKLGSYFCQNHAHLPSTADLDYGIY